MAKANLHETDAIFAHAQAAYKMACGALESLGDDYSNEECDLLSDAHFVAMDALLLTPAPDFPALVQKMEVFATEECFDMSNKDELFAALIADVRRLGRRL